MKSLAEIYRNYQTPDGQGDKGTAHSYIEKYEELLEPYRDNSTVLEIGIAGGYSLHMWGEYFNESKIYGVDISPEILNNPNLISDKFNIIHSDATTPEFLEKIKNLTFDVIIDDGSHFLHHQLSSFNLLKSKLKKGGIYIIEDVTNLDDNIKDIFKKLHNNCEIVDLRNIKGRYDDVLIIYRF
jgi:cephalosporin hydroxylase